MGGFIDESLASDWRPLRNVRRRRILICGLAVAAVTYTLLAWASRRDVASESLEALQVGGRPFDRARRVHAHYRGAECGALALARTLPHF